MGIQGVLELMSSLLERTVNHNLIYAIQSLIQLWMFSLSGIIWTIPNRGSFTFKQGKCEGLYQKLIWSDTGYPDTRPNI